MFTENFVAVVLGGHSYIMQMVILDMYHMARRLIASIYISKLERLRFGLLLRDICEVQYETQCMV